jgi:phosphatidylserine/phosphatidylglycerophosphate/cardiolipin synthase-like enzyme
VNATIRILLITELAKQMKTLTADQARTLADELTAEVSTYVKGIRKGGSPEVPHLERLPSFPKETWNELTVGVPWEAYSYSHGVYRGKAITAGTQALCSAPAQLDGALTERTINSGLWGGSLLVALGRILEGVERELVVFSPYWRSDGVQSLLASAGRGSYTGVSVTVFSQPKAWMTLADKEGLALFVNTLWAAGALVQVLAPRAHDGLMPNLHAKLIIADSVIAYIGSANFTKSGLDHGLEAGVLVEGETAAAFSNWSKALAAACEGW